MVKKAKKEDVTKEYVLKAGTMYVMEEGQYTTNPKYAKRFVNRDEAEEFSKGEFLVNELMDVEVREND